jgi:hypothetical protein
VLSSKLSTFDVVARAGFDLIALRAMETGKYLERPENTNRGVVGGRKNKAFVVLRGVKSIDVKAYLIKVLAFS